MRKLIVVGGTTVMAAGVVLACSSFSGQDVASSGEGGTPADAATTATDAPAAIVDAWLPTPDGSADLFIETFESYPVGGACGGPWMNISARTTIVTEARKSGTQSCKVCVTAATQPPLSATTIAQDGGSYVITAWMAVPSDGGLADGGTAFAMAAMSSSEGGASVTGTNQFLGSGEWVEVQGTGMTPKPVTSALLKIYPAPQRIDDCFYVDDVQFLKTQ